MAAHARLSASAAHRWIPCPGSVNLSAPIPDRSSPDAADGTRAHDLAAAMLLAHRGKVNTAEYSEEMVGHVVTYVDYCQSQTQPGDLTMVEVDLTPGLKQLDQDCGGTTDFARYRPKTQHLLVVDFKYGAGVFVPVENNPQLMLYALGALLGSDSPVKTITIAVVQPRAEGAEGAIREWTVPAHVIVDFAADVKEAAAKTREVPTELNPGEKQCRFCKARAVCPALEKQQHALIAADFTAVETYDPAKLADALRLIPMVEARIKALRDFAYAELAVGRPVPGYKLVAKRATRKWADESKAEAMIAPHLGPDAYEPKSLKSPAAIEKLVGKKGFVQYADLAPAVSSGYTLASDSDPRPGVALIAENDFPLVAGPVED
jgi:hypothetical protein